MMGDRNRSFHNSNVNQTQQISKSVFVTNFPDSTSSRDFWKTCSAYGTVVDVFIPSKKSKAGKRFAFVRFIRVTNLDRLVENLCTIWIGRFHLYTNQEGYVSLVFAEPALVLNDSCIKELDLKLSLMGKVKAVPVIPNLPVLIADNSFVNDERIVWVSVEGLPIKAWTPNSFRKIASFRGELVEWDDTEQNSLSCKNLCLKTKMDVIINDKRKIIVQGNAFWIRVKEFDAWVPDFEDDNDNLSSDEDEPIANNSNNIDDDSDVDRVSYRKWIMLLILFVWNLLKAKQERTNLERMYRNLKTLSIYTECCEKIEEINSQGTADCVQSLSNKIGERKKQRGMSSLHSTNSGSIKYKAGGSIIDLMDELVNVGQTMGYNMDGCIKDIESIIGLGNKAKRSWINKLCQNHRINFVSLQETKAEEIDVCSIKELWGNLYFDHAVGSSVGYSGGIVCIWDPNMFVKYHVSKSDYFVALMGTWIPTSTKLLIISVYAPQELSEKWDLWDYLHLLINIWDGETVLMGDFNEVRSERERFGSIFNQQGAAAFNNFISSNSFIDPPLDGYAFTWSHKSASKMSKLDRFLLSEGLMELFPHLSAICLDKNLSDHRPILLRETCTDYGPTPFRFFHSWFTMDGFDSFVERTWKSLNVADDNGLIRLKKKLQLLKIAIKAWTKDAKMKSNEKKFNIQQNLLKLDKLIDQGRSNDEILRKRSMLLNDLHEINSKNASELSQKAKIRWSIEGDENSKYFHGIINKKRSQLAIRGVLVDGDWISEPSLVKSEFFKHFNKQFSPPQSSRICFDYDFPTRLSSDHVEDLERDVSYEEVKAAVWDCGLNKSPGPDGYSFEFFRKYWSFIDHDILMAVKEFFTDGYFPRGCNSSFIALIPKIQDAKFVKDFRPISLIGSVYKIIAKILANRLCLVLPDLISDVQSAFVSNRQILDGPFILNELISWCKHKNFNGMIFKVDFEKAFDSVKWDYLDETLKSFGFGHKWRTWISGCLNNAMGSVLVNGNPSPEFQFFKGLKQGDPLSPFLFILIMETLHLSFRRILNAGLYNGISINDSFTISHLFYADDVVFVGEWKDKNIHTLLNVLKCFYLASGLKINLHKSKLMGIGVNMSVVESAANLIGCSILHSPFNYLGVKVGSNMTRISSWDDVVSKVSSRLSKWKLKSLSIGGRLTLLKSVLTSTPLYHMSIYKVPMGVLKKLESIRRNFFNGNDGSVRKHTWFNWSKALASKKNGGLGVSSFFAYNRALLFKWVWRFFTDGSSLWSSFIKALFGNHGALGNSLQTHRRSTWIDIINAIKSLNDKGINLSYFIRKKIGNGENTSFWDDIWLGDIAFKDQFKRLYALEERKSISVAEKLGHTSICHSFRRPPRGGIEQESLNSLCMIVNAFVLPNMDDRWSWSLEGSGLFTVKSSRSFIDDIFLPNAGVSTRWIKVLPIKINVFAWKVFLDALPTRINLSLRGIDIPSIQCPICNLAVESSSHIFFSCPVARKVWRKIMIWWELDDPAFHSYNEWLLWIVNIRLPKQLKEFLEGICYVMWWLIWKFRNLLLFSDSPPKQETLFDDVVQMSYLWMNSRFKSKINWISWLKIPNCISL
ncbi:RNA-directed DNA polymerase, eukaryota [Tanacetum coccineum]|uniref:RNA-directed DNA polymerase, eukaryota n=1 Tax=Tanacetum coccineum TaxID=301880 RepID=A0ABQ5E9W4_9ASTR